MENYDNLRRSCSITRPNKKKQVVPKYISMALQLNSADRYINFQVS
jgi:hypothetical protein